MPATEEAVSTAIAPMSREELALAAASLHHPRLPPVTIPEDGSLTPQAAAVVAVLQSPTLRAARARRGVAAAQLVQAGILPNPQLSGSMDFPIAGATDGTVNAFGIGATWDVTSLIGREAAMSAARHGAEAVDLEIAWQEWQTALAAKLHATRVLWLSQQRGGNERRGGSRDRCRTRCRGRSGATAAGGFVRGGSGSPVGEFAAAAVAGSAERHAGCGY
jgi:hypothetical protein